MRRRSETLGIVTAETRSASAASVSPSSPNAVELAASLELYGHALLWFVAGVVLLLMIAVAVPVLGLTGNALWLSFFFFTRQDVPFLLLFLLPLFIGARTADGRDATWLEVLSRPRAVFAVALLLLAVCWAGHRIVLQDYDLARDEQMANFDAYIFSHGRLFWPLPDYWRPLALALNQTFILPIGNHEAWVSEYLPVNAAFRAAVGMIAPQSLASPLLAAVGALALWRISLRLWPEDAQTRAVALLFYAGSSQVVITAMTAFAMTAHLALDLVWLALFLRDRKSAHVGAVSVGFFATGLHQPIFHPLFVLPFIGWLAVQRRWRLFGFYAASYALIGAFWIAWPIWLSAHGVSPVPADSSHGVGVVGRLTTMLFAPNVGSLWLMALNLIRFVTWQHLLLMPLLIVGLGVAWREPGLARVLAIGLLLPLPVMLILQADQGFGWGYRYVHSELGNACLLGAYGWRELAVRGVSLQRALLATSVATFALLIPGHASMANRLVEPWVEIDRAITRGGAGVAIVDDDAAVFSSSLVINRPDLSNRPIRLLASKLHPADMFGLCKLGPLTFVDAKQLRPLNDLLGSKPRSPYDGAEGALETEARRLRCNVLVPA